MKKLLVWEYALQSMDEAEKMGFSRVSSGVLGISESNQKKLGVVYFIRIAPVLRPEGKHRHDLSLSQASESNSLLIPSSAPHQNALSPVPSKKIKSIDSN